MKDPTKSCIRFVMVIIRASAQFARLYKCDRDELDLAHPGLLMAWHADTRLVSGAGRFILLSEERTLFSFLFHMGRSRSLEVFAEVFYERIALLRESARIWDQEPKPGLHYGKRTDRRVIGSQNDFWREVEYRFGYDAVPVEPRTLYAVQHNLNSTPLSYLGMDSPQRALNAALGQG